MCNLIHPNSFVKNKYFLFFIDDFTIKTWVYFLKKKKSKVFTTFKKFKALVKKGDPNIKATRFGRGDEFTSKEFVEHCESHKIHWYPILA